jgi:uncharacterized protein (DUF1330 family)
VPKKGYWVATVSISDPAAYKDYMDYVLVPFGKFGGRYLTRGGPSEVVEGESLSRIIVIEFADYPTALACYRSPEYAKAIALRQDASINNIVVVEGYDGLQPGDAAPG